MRRALVYVSRWWQTVSLICVSVLVWEDARRRNRCDEALPWPCLAWPQQIWRNSNLIVPGWTLAWLALHAAQAAFSQIKWSEIWDFLGLLLWFFFLYHYFFLLKMFVKAWKCFGTSAAVLTACVVKLSTLPPNQKAHEGLMVMASAAAGKKGAFTAHVG